ncbi:thioredoxin domain-containing protein [Actinopolyspora mortivallis]|uniref:N-acylglucosamine 2-epimerase n=1 Tax=Actinopolyspora mortivallis TaxID=33906 RepID=A0A2T0H0M6_ACTMO|nr:thioredoxin domain-containing protein [Actinopolyspora mortivallis]PRW64909.1 N-acylglucosamine 2-epimerase [Actinopolyspora mortivallis]
MAQRLAQATSPYLLQHADNPVDWWPWCPEAFEEARRRDVPVLLSVGYAACHWCHVMAHESFEDPDTAAVMNEHFVNIKVDREERPDIDAVYIQATQAMTGQAGWPMTCFLTPEGEPFHCGTYYPAAPMRGMPSFRQLLDAVVSAWNERTEEIRQSATRVVEHLESQRAALPESPVDEEALSGAVTGLAEEFDADNGGFGDSPKFPPSMVLEFLLRHHERLGEEGTGRRAGEMAESVCSAMARGGIYDQLAGGFSRYSVDAHWTVPHFEKMLYDNALLLRVYAHLTRRAAAGAEVREPELAERVTVETAEFLLRDLGTEQGGFAASLDADTDGEEGATYVWTPEQLREVLGEEDGAWAAEVFGVTEQGTFERGTSTLRLSRDPEDTSRWNRVRAELFAARRRRRQPARDDKVVTAWNGLAITALVEAATALDRPEWLRAAENAARLLTEEHLRDGRLVRNSRAGVAGTAEAVLEDYGCLAEGLLAVHQATARPHWLELACGMLDTALELFSDEQHPGAFHDTASDAERLVNRPADPTDNASPSGAAAVTSALVTASALTGPERSQRYRTAADQALNRAGLLARRAPRFAGHWLSAAEATRHGPLQVAVVGPEGRQRAELAEVARENAPGGAVTVVGDPGSTGTPLLEDRGTLDGSPAVHVCRGFVCERPVGTAEEVRAALRG